MLRKIANFYIEGFRNMSWGKPLWILIVVKLVFLFLIMRLIFFKPVLRDMNDNEKSEHVAEELMKKN